MRRCPSSGSSKTRSVGPLVLDDASVSLVPRPVRASRRRGMHASRKRRGKSRMRRCSSGKQGGRQDSTDAGPKGGQSHPWKGKPSVQDSAAVGLHDDASMSGLEDGNAALCAGVLRLHIVQIRSVVLGLVIELRQAAHVRSTCGRREGRTTLQSIRLRICHSARAIGYANRTARNTGGVCACGASILGDYRTGVASVCAAFRAILAWCTRPEWSGGSKHWKPRRVCRLRAERLDVGRNVTQRIVGPVETRIETAGSPGSPPFN